MKRSCRPLADLRRRRPKGGGGLLTPARQARSSAYAGPDLDRADVVDLSAPSSPRHARERGARRAVSRARSRTVQRTRCLAPGDDLERSWLEAVEYLAEPCHPFLVAGEGTPTPDGRHASSPSRWLQSTHSLQRLTNSSSLPALTRQVVCVYGFSISPSLGGRTIDDGAHEECRMPRVVETSRNGDTGPEACCRSSGFNSQGGSVVARSLPRAAF